ncbi:MAG: hypothetical protein ACMUEL_00355 [Flavobacteriales bacterium Tduv]
MVKKETQSGVDTQVKWLKKSSKFYYGYKKYIGGGGDKNRMILAVHIVAANEHDSRGLKLLISKLGYTPPQRSICRQSLPSASQRVLLS